MHEDNSLLVYFDIDQPKTQSKLSNEPQQEPFQIIYNARSTKNTQTRKASYCKISDLPQKLKKPRKMTLPIESSSSYLIYERVVLQTYSDQNFPLSTQSLPQQQIETQEDIDEMDLQKGIQCAIGEESELDKESWFGIRSQNPEFMIME